MRITTLFTLALGFASPLAAQATAQHKVVFLNGDTLVTIEKGDRNSCTVKIGDRTLGERQAGEICAVKERSITFTTDHNRALFELDGVRTRLRALTDSNLSTTRLNALRQQEALLAQALSARSQAFNTEAMEELLARTRELGEPRFFGTLLERGQQGSIIGVSIDPRPRETDRWGAFVAGVTPNGPADRAGIRSGDIIAKVDGQSITSGRTERAATDEESLVWLRLSEVVRKLEPGKAVELEYRRDGRNQTTRVTPIEDNRWFAAAIPPGATVLGRTAPPDAPRAGALIPTLPRSGAVTVAPAPSSGSGSFYFSAGGSIANLELAPMNEKLGSYFGTSRGVLILSAPAERNLGLEAGDVVVNVDGRTVDTPSELIRVLRSYDRDKQFTMQVMRQKQRQSITTTLP